MSILDKITNKIPTNTPAPEQLNEQELEFLLTLIKNNSFKGEYVELVYNTTFKLQNQYLVYKK
jgi:hypothetical protein